MPIIDFFDRGWASSPDAVAYCTDDESWTYDEARELSCRIGHALLDEGLQREGKVAVLSPNAPLAWICVLGVWRAGGAWVPLNPGNPAHENADLLRRFDVEVLFYDPALADQVEEFVRQGLDLRLVALRPAADVTVLEDWLGGRPSYPPVVVGQQMDDVVAISPTGGTTGVPKGVMNTHRSFSVMVVHQMLALAYTEDEHPVNLAAAPMTHTAGLFSLQTSARGGTVVVVPRATPEHILPAIEKHGVTELFLPPTVIYRLLDVLADRVVDTSSLKYVMYAAAPMSSRKLRAGIERLGPVFIECYGQVEAPAAITFMRPEEHLRDGVVADDDRLSSCGRPYPLVRVAIKDPDEGTVLAPGETGEICVQGDLVMKGYYRDPERTAETIRDGWLHTGDLGRLDEDGYLHLTDRKKDMIITGGFNVYPGEVEQVIWSLPEVEDCAVVGAPDADWGERVTAVVELKPGRSLDEDAVVAHCRSSLSGVKTPKQIVFVDQLPRSANGKVLKRDVRQRFWAAADRAI
ncbi:AMP-binding protein [Nocardioides zeae]|uniref:Long-chain fatty acid--CoA ligase n=1 Tax=Nocardioides zeae TaxID=1457234 RepID=A0A6P0HIJ6_9ACTN|nr:AMP-binding protein [Nocardioides zeae]NEN78057.1 long-chain fatty acid--CoA ligase [Nocardioides zeae]